MFDTEFGAREVKDIFPVGVLVLLVNRSVNWLPLSVKTFWTTIVIAIEPNKATGILGALRTGVIDTLATTTANALSVLSLDRALQSSASARVEA